MAKSIGVIGFQQINQQTDLTFLIGVMLAELMGFIRSF
jgi:hypothetical protein